MCVVGGAREREMYSRRGVIKVGPGMHIRTKCGRDIFTLSRVISSRLGRFNVDPLAKAGHGNVVLSISSPVDSQPNLSLRRRYVYTCVGAKCRYMCARARRRLARAMAIPRELYNPESRSTRKLLLGREMRRRVVPSSSIAPLYARVHIQREQRAHMQKWTVIDAPRVISHFDGSLYRFFGSNVSTVGRKYKYFVIFVY